MKIFYFRSHQHFRNTPQSPNSDFWGSITSQNKPPEKLENPLATMQNRRSAFDLSNIGSGNLASTSQQSVLHRIAQLLKAKKSQKKPHGDIHISAP